ASPVYMRSLSILLSNSTATTVIYTLSLHDALPILYGLIVDEKEQPLKGVVVSDGFTAAKTDENGVYQLVRNKKAKFVFYSTPSRSEEHTSELQSRENLVCRLLLEKKNKSR